MFAEGLKFTKFCRGHQVFRLTFLFPGFRGTVGKFRTRVHRAEIFVHGEVFVFVYLQRYNRRLDGVFVSMASLFLLLFTCLFIYLVRCLLSLFCFDDLDISLSVNIPSWDHVTCGFEIA